MKFLLDTNVFREIGKSEPHGNVAGWLRGVDDVDLAISALTVREVTKGIAKLRGTKPRVAEQLNERVAEVFAAFGERILPVSREIAELWGVLLAESDKHVDDTGLAATARNHGLVLVTRNLKHFAGRRVRTVDPFKAASRASRS